MQPNPYTAIAHIGVFSENLPSGGNGMATLRKGWEVSVMLYFACRKSMRVI
jgi:hypothetical protein